MAPASARMASWLALLLPLVSVQAQSESSATTTRDSGSAFWTYTSRFQQSISSSTYTYLDGDQTTYRYTTSRTIKSTITPSQTPFRTSTYSRYYTSDLELVYAFYSADAVAETDLEPEYSYGASRTSSGTTTRTYFYMPVTYTAPTSCPTTFTWTTNVSVSIPTEVRDQITPVSKTTGSSSTYYYYDDEEVETWYLSSGAAPFRSTTEFYYSAYVRRCSTPYSYSTATSGSGGRTSGGGSSGTSLTVCSWYSGCTSLKTWVIVIASIIPSIFVLGFLESWIWFRRLMLGKSALRFGTVCWIFLSLWIACFTRTQSARSAEDQKLLREKWNKTGSFEAFKLWWKWGFRHSYPVPILGQYSRNTVGIVPEGQPLPQMGQTAPTTYPGFTPGPGAPGAVYPSGVPPTGSTYYPPPQGWSPAQGAVYPVPPPGQSYIPPPGAGGYYEQSKDAPSVTETTISGAPQLPHPVPSPVASPPPNVAEAPSPLQPEPAAQLPTAPASPPPGQTGPPPPRPT